MSNVLLVHAHPEPRSLTSALKDVAVDSLTRAGHSVQVSDLYAMGWKAVADRADFTGLRHPERLRYSSESRHAFITATQAPDVQQEQEKLLWADGIVLSFPLWWYAEPAILKGWVDRVFVAGFAYGTGRYDATHWGDRFGEGVLAGKRAMVIVSIGGRRAQYGDRGVNGRLDDILWPLQHGALFYAGAQVVDPFVVYESDRVDETRWPRIASALAARVDGLFTSARIPFRTQNGGHYDGEQKLRPGLGQGADGSRIHLVQPGDPVEILNGQPVAGAALDTPPE